MALVLSTNLRNDIADAITAKLDAGAAGATIEIYTAPRPASPDVAATGTLLATLNMSATSFGNAAGGVITAASITGEASADATGTAAWFRISDSNGLAHVDGDVATSGAELNVNTVAFVTGASVDITSGTATAPNA